MKNKNNKFYEFKNESFDEYGLYIYGALTDDKSSDWFPSEQDVDLSDFKNALSEITPNSTLNIYVNSPGGSVFASSTMASMLQRAKETNGLKIISYIDGLCASATTFLVMVSDEIKMYSNSMFMVHKPMSFAYGNADDMQKEIDTLNSIQENVMMPLYMKKAKVSEETIRNLINVESWLSAKETNDIFNITLLDTAKEVNACIDLNLFKMYKNVPDNFKIDETKLDEEQPRKIDELEDENIQKEQTEIIEENISGNEEPKQQDVVSNNQNIDYSYFDNKLDSIKEVIR